MNRQRLRFIGALIVWSLASLVVGYALHGRPALALLGLVLVLAGGGLAWWRWGSMDEARRCLRRVWAGVEGLQWTILLVLIAVAVALALFGAALGDQTRDALSSLATNLATEFAGAAATYWLLQWVIGRRARREELIAQMGCDVRDVAVPAADELRRKGWLTDGSLDGADLREANLSEARLIDARLRESLLIRADLSKAVLSRADLAGACLYKAKLRGANLLEAILTDAELNGAEFAIKGNTGDPPQRANLSGADLTGAELCGATLMGADLTEAVLVDAELKWADLSGADLRMADLSKADLKGVDGYTEKQLGNAKSLAGATLPDGTKLSEEDWEAEFEDWRKKQEKQESGH